MKLNLPFSKKEAKATPAPISSQLETFTKGLVSVKDILAPGAIEVDFTSLKIGPSYYRSLFTAAYPRYVSANWLSPLISFDHTLRVSMFIYPVESKAILDELRRKVAEMEATIELDIKQGRVVDPAVQVALDDALTLQSQLAKGAEHFFQFGLYVTIPAETQDKLEEVSKEVISTLGSLMIVAKPASLQMEEGFKTTLPIGTDTLMITRNMDTTSLATTFPFTSSDLSANEGILYGINEHNDSLVIFDRFSMENANEVVLGKSGGGKSYLIKLEALRSLMFGAEILIIDPEAEYRQVAEALGGEFIDFSFSAPDKINPFDLSGVYEEGENELGLKILSLHSLMRLIMGQLTPKEDAILDRALITTYKQKGITPDPRTQKKEPPLMEDLYKVLLGMEEPEAKGLAERLEKFIKGSLAGIFSQASTVDIKNNLTVFCIKDLEEELRPIAMFIILDFVWTRVKKSLKKRILIVDEAWYLMQYPDSASFLYGIAKRARKYFLGLTTITQDVNDFLSSDFGKAIITNSSIQILLKQSTAAIDKLAETFYLSQGEKHLLLAADVGEGLFFAGSSHAAIRIIAAPFEHELVTSKPEDILRREKAHASAPKSQEKTPPYSQDTSNQPPAPFADLFKPEGGDKV
ncbi:ATP-binding protein [Candidatus Microgenomates bacterium]|nr:ATP-binding protein [Candidatus Microgenomates bacterium]